jgi:hypothetical protein
LNQNPVLNGKGFTVVAITAKAVSTALAGTPREVRVNGIPFNISEGVKGTEGGMDEVVHTRDIVHTSGVNTTQFYDNLPSLKAYHGKTKEEPPKGLDYLLVQHPPRFSILDPDVPSPTNVVILVIVHPLVIAVSVDFRKNPLGIPDMDFSRLDVLNSECLIAHN